MEGTHSNPREIFDACLDLATAEEREALLNKLAEDNLTLARTVADLLIAHDEAEGGGFFSANPRWYHDTHSDDSPPLQAEDSEGSQIDRYKLLERIGEGGMGVVYMAEQEKPVRRRIALKILKLGMDTKQVVARFEAERQALAMMDNPNIAKLLDAGVTETGRPYFVMELVRGVAITKFCDENRLSIKERLQLFIPVCRAIQHAHQKGVIHRDIKPSNILVSLDGGIPHPMVIDFGVAKAIDQTLTEKTLFTRFAQMVGTPSYMSPEQTMMSIQDVDTRADVYSLGILLYELLTGSTPFPEERLQSAGYAEMHRMIKEEEPVRPSTLMSRLDGQRRTASINRGTEPATLIKVFKGDLDWIVLKAIEKERTRRYETANGLAVDVVRHLNDEPVTAAAPTWRYRFLKLYRRNRATLHAVAAVVVILALTSVVSTLLAIRSNVAERKAAIALEHEAEMRDRAESAVEVARRHAYAADMNLVQGALEKGNLGRARLLLDRHRPSPGQTDIRGWEWRYLWQQSQSQESETLFDSDAFIEEIVTSPDGKWLAAADEALGATGKVSIWDLPNRRKLAELDHRGHVDLAISPVDPVLAFTDEADPSLPGASDRIRLWNIETRQFIRDLPLRTECYNLNFSADGQILMSATQHSFILWEIATGKKIAEHKPYFRRGSGNRIAVSANLGVAYFIGENVSRIQEIDLRSGQVTQWDSIASDEKVVALTLSPDGTNLATGDGYSASTIRIWDTQTRREIGRLEGHRSGICSLVFWPDGRTLASASGDQTLRLWDLQEMKPTRVLRGHAQQVRDIVLSPDGFTLISASRDGSVKFWDTSEANEESGLIQLQTGIGFANHRETNWAFAPDSKSIHVIDRKAGQIHRWTGKFYRDRQIIIQHDDLRGATGYTAMTARPEVFSETGKLVTIRSDDGQIEVWDIPQGQVVAELAVSNSRVIPIGFTRDDSLWVGVPERSELQEWDLTSRSMRKAVPVPEFMQYAGTVNRRTLTDRYYFTVKLGGGGQLVDLETGEISNRQYPGKVWSSGVSPDGETLAIAHNPGVLAIRKTRSLLHGPDTSEIRLGGIFRDMFSIAFSPDGKRVAASSQNDETIRLWDTTGYQELLTLPGEGGVFSGSAFSPDGNILGAIRTDGTLHLWRAPSWEEIAAIGD